VHLFADELARLEKIHDEVDLGIELPVVCELANEFLAALPPLDEDAKACDQTLAALVRNTSVSLKIEVAERLAHLEDGPRRTIRMLAHDSVPAVAVPVLRYSPLLTEDELAAIACLRSERGLSEEHLAALAARRDLNARITDILTGHGTWRVLEALAGNETAQFSLLGLCRLAMRSYRRGPRVPRGSPNENGKP
jgi:uncharacterized protein (DUF2336 family)